MKKIIGGLMLVSFLGALTIFISSVVGGLLSGIIIVAEALAVTLFVGLAVILITSNN